MRVCLIHWKASEAAARIEELRAAGYQVEHLEKAESSTLRPLRANPPAAFVIDLTRLPSHGAQVGAALRNWKDTRTVPLVFAGGEPEKVDRAKRLLPDAVFTPWTRIRSALKQAIARPPAAPVVPSMDIATHRPLAAKLGIKPESTVALLAEPEDFVEKLGDLPETVRFVRRPGKACNLTIWFTRSRAEIEREIDLMAVQIGEGALWVAWPKKSSGVVCDVTQQIIREAGLNAGLVDYRICSIDDTWSGLCFCRRKK